MEEDSASGVIDNAYQYDQYEEKKTMNKHSILGGEGGGDIDL